MDSVFSGTQIYFYSVAIGARTLVTQKPSIASVCNLYGALATPQHGACTHAVNSCPFICFTYINHKEFLRKCTVKGSLRSDHKLSVQCNMVLLGLCIIGSKTNFKCVQQNTVTLHNHYYKIQWRCISDTLCLTNNFFSKLKVFLGGGYCNHLFTFQFTVFESRFMGN